MLVQQLIIYKRYKEIAAELGERELLNARAYLRLAPPPKVEGKLDLSGIGLRELLDAAISAFEQLPDKPELGTVVRAPKVTIGDKIRHITGVLQERGKTTFQALLGEGRSRLEIVVTFLAMLELVKRFRVSATQSGIFGEIELVPAEAWDDDADIETEFTE
jgi:segregation and condensation protein A